MITGIEIILVLGGLLGAVHVYYMLGGTGWGCAKHEDGPREAQFWPFTNEKRIGDKPFVETPVPEYPCWFTAKR